jgi:hypothetical protein
MNKICGNNIIGVNIDCVSKYCIMDIFASVKRLLKKTLFIWFLKKIVSG